MKGSLRFWNLSFQFKFNRTCPIAVITNDPSRLSCLAWSVEIIKNRLCIYKKRNCRCNNKRMKMHLVEMRLINAKKKNWAKYMKKPACDASSCYCNNPFNQRCRLKLSLKFELKIDSKFIVQSIYSRPRMPFAGSESSWCTRGLRFLLSLLHVRIQNRSSVGFVWHYCISDIFYSYEQF